MSGLTFVRIGRVGTVDWSKSAEPDLEVLALFPCLEIRRREEARMEEVVLMLKVWWESPPVPTISHWGVLVKLWNVTSAIRLSSHSNLSSQVLFLEPR